MGKKFVSLVCVLCAIHAHCAVHHGPAEAAPATDVPRVGWPPAGRHGSGLNPHLDLKPAALPRHVVAKAAAAAGSTGNESRNTEAESRVKNPEAIDATSPRETANDNVETVASASSTGTKLRDAETESLGANAPKADKTLLPESGVVGSVPASAGDGLKTVSSEKLRSEREDEDTVSAAASRRPRESAADGAEDADMNYFIRKVFDKFGDGETISHAGFQQMMAALRLDAQALAVGAAPPTPAPEGALAVRNGSNGTASTERCATPTALFAAAAAGERGLTGAGFRRLCPSLVYGLAAATDRERSDGCLRLPAPPAPMRSTSLAEDDDQPAEVNRGKVWLYSTLSIVAISLCGLLGVAVIPIMKNLYYQQMLQFFVALAVGTLCGDALLHLLPHAMASSGAHDHGTHDHSLHDHGAHGEQGGHDHASHDEKMWKGLVAALGVVFLFFTEKSLSLVSEWRQQHQRLRKDPPRVRVMRDKDAAVGNATVGEKLCKHKYSSYPYCYNEIAAEMTEDSHHKNGHHSTRDNHNHTSSPGGDNHVAVAAVPTEPPAEGAAPAEAGDGKVPCVHDHHGDSACRNHVAAVVAAIPAADGEKAEPGKEQDTIGRDSYTVILREHEQTHHGHSHTHGHVHSPPESLSAVAWMVVMGDGLHNFTDGMAIGAAFAANIAGGFSTAVAVFCHELPHELGDFAVLLKAGMSAKQAVFYNVISSVLCLFGMVIGVSLGNWESATQWIFAAAAGMFLYIALVDMIPELSSSHSTPGGSLIPCALQITGLLLGLGIMFVIAMHEEALKNVFTDKP